MKDMSKQILSVILSLAVVLSGCSNVLETFAVKDTDAAYYEDATKALNAQNYDLSLEKFGKLSAGYLSNPDVKKYYAGALAGKCGMNFTGLFTTLSTTDISGSPIFKFLMNLFTNKVVSPSHCTLAETQIKQIWAARTATQGEQLFMVLLSMSKMGSYLRAKADKDGALSLGDNNTDASFEGCANVNDTNHLTDAEVTEIITGFSLMLLNITSFTASLNGSVGSSVTTINTACALLTPNPCTTTESANVTPAMIAQMRDVLATSAALVTMPLGIGTCAGADPTVCCP